jgi:hypothetical protein
MSLPRNNDPWCISVPSHPSVSADPVRRWCSLFPFRDSFLSSFVLRCRLPYCLTGQISFYSHQRGHTKCFSKVPLQFCTPQMHSLILTHGVSGTWTRRWFLRENLSLNCPGHPLQEKVNVAGEHSLYYILASFWYILWAV